MYLLSNAIHNIWRNKGRNLLVASIFLVIVVATVIALMINNTTAGIIDDYKTRFASEVMLTPNMDKMVQQAQQNANGSRSISRPQIDPSDYIAFSQSDYLASTVFVASTKVNSDDIKPIDEDKGGGGNPTLISAASGPSGSDQPPDIQPSGTQYYAQLIAGGLDDFTNGNRSIAEGAMPQNEGECIISTDLADNSGLAIGDQIVATSQLDKPGDDPSQMQTKDISYTLTIVGTYYDATDEYTDNFMQNAFTNRRNEILTTFDTVIAPMEDGYMGIEVSATYYLKDPSMLDDFSAELYAKGLDPMFDVTTDQSSYDSVVGPVEKIKGISVAFVIVVLVFGAIIIALLTSIAVRERKYEIGVLRAMGMKKGKVTLGIWLEMLVITCICLIVGVGIGVVAAQPVTNALLNSQIEAVEAAQESAQNPGGMTQAGPVTSMGGVGFRIDGNSNSVEPLSRVDVSLDLATLGEIVAIALLLSSGAVFIGTRKITKYEPIKILMERN